MSAGDVSRRCGLLVDFQLVHLAENRTLDCPACVRPRLPRLTADM